MKQQETKQPKKQKKGGSVLLTLGIIACVAVMAFSGFQLLRTALAYKAGTSEYDNLRQFTSATVDTEEIVISRSDAADDEQAVDAKLQVAQKAPIEVDFPSLKQINEDIVGWLYIGALDISYPIVQGTDNEYYLHHTFEKQENFSGAIFVEEQNASDFKDPNTIIYGHNMKNQSMFGKLRTLMSDNLYENDPYFWILTPEGDYKYHMFSLHVVETNGEVYTLFNGTDKTFIEWANHMQDTSSVPVGEETFDEHSKIVTLSTCTGDDSTRFVVQGVRMQ